MAPPILLPEPWSTLARKLGSTVALALELRCSGVTLRRWAHGTQPPGPQALAWIAATFRKHKVPPPF